MGSHIVCPGDWIVTGVRGETYPVKPDVFAETYDPVPLERRESAVVVDDLGRVGGLST